MSNIKQCAFCKFYNCKFEQGLPESPCFDCNEYSCWRPDMKKVTSSIQQYGGLQYYFKEFYDAVAECDDLLEYARKEEKGVIFEMCNYEKGYAVEAKIRTFTTAEDEIIATWRRYKGDKQ